MMASDLKPTEANTDVFAIVAAYNEADRIAATLAGLADAFPGARVWVADDGSSDGTAAVAEAAGAKVVRSDRVVGKGGAVTLAAREALGQIAGAQAPERVATVAPGGGAAARRGDPGASIVVFCDGDLGATAARLGPLADVVRGGDADLAVAVFAKRVGGGLGVAVGFAAWAIRRRCGLALRAPISGQRAMRVGVLAQVLPFAHGFGMEVGMTIDAARAGARVGEVEVDLSHRATGRTLRGFVHRGRQLIDFIRVYLARR